MSKVSFKDELPRFYLYLCKNLVMLQAQREEPPLDVKCRDKFLILSIFLNETTEKMGITELVSKQQWYR